jgi:hypothetical protein
MQTELVSLLFQDFKHDFKHFFDPCQKGFTNEFIINMYARISPPQSYLILPKRHVQEIFFIRQGAVGICDSRGQGPHIILPSCAYFGDYQILFDLKANFAFRTMAPHEAKKLNISMSSKNEDDNRATEGRSMDN